MVSLYGGKLIEMDKYFGGAGVRTEKFLKYGRYQLNMEGQAWYQPVSILMGTAYRSFPAKPIPTKTAWGGLIGAMNSFGITDYIVLHLNLSYKTAGFIEGETIDKGFMLRGGFPLLY